MTIGAIVDCGLRITDWSEPGRPRPRRVALAKPVAHVLVCCAIAAAALPAAADEKQPVTETAPPAAAIDVEAVVLRLLSEAEVPAQEAGVTTRLAVREGDRVKQGDLLAQVDDRVAQMAQRAAELAYEAAKAKATNDVRLRYATKALEVSEAELRRSTESIERFAKSVSQSQIDVEQLTVQKNRLETEQAEHEQAIARLEMQAKENELSAARLEVARRQIVAPIDGVVVQVFVRQGEWVEPGQKALRIVNVDRLKAEGFVPAKEATAALAGAPVRLTVDLGGGPDPSFTGTVVFVSPEVDPITGQVRIWAEIDNRDGRLRPGQSARMTVGK
jgi:multidrug efflux pump subunit AcrA (membrane-fusion protein)